MHVPTGQFVEAEDPSEARAKLEKLLGERVDAADIVMVDGNLQQVQALGQRVRLGSKELAKRKARRGQQQDSRRKNRP